MKNQEPEGNTAYGVNALASMAAKRKPIQPATRNEVAKKQPEIVTERPDVPPVTTESKKPITPAVAAPLQTTGSNGTYNKTKTRKPHKTHCNKYRNTEQIHKIGFELPIDFYEELIKLLKKEGRTLQKVGEESLRRYYEEAMAQHEGE